MTDFFFSFLINDKSVLSQKDILLFTSKQIWNTKQRQRQIETFYLSRISNFTLNIDGIENNMVGR